MKIIFLDCDGVMLSRKVKDRTTLGQDPILPCHMIELNYIIEKTDASVVITSCWRKVYTLGELKRKFRDAGFTGKIIDCTGPSKYRRGLEIQDWLKNVPRRVDSFVILNDSVPEVMDPYGDRLVATVTETGLEREHSEKAIAILNKTTP